MPEIKSFDNTKLHIHYQKSGKYTLVFLHGWPLNHTFWTKEVNFLKKKNYGILNLDLRGHGKSGKPADLNLYKIENFARDIKFLIELKRIKNPILIGHSFGGMIILKYLDLFPDNIKGIVLIDTTYQDPLKTIQFLKYKNITPLTMFLLNYILERKHVQKRHFEYVNFSKFKSHSDFYYWLKGAKGTPIKVIAAILKDMLRFDGTEILKKISVPTLIIEGECDDKTPIKIAKKMHKMIKNSELVIIKDAPHDSVITHANKINQAILDFLTNTKF